MRTFAAADLQRNPAEIQKAALTGPVLLTYHDKPRFVMMSLEHFAHLQGRRALISSTALPPAVVARIREIKTAQNSKPDSIDKLVLATINAPYKRSIDAATLRECLADAKLDQWSVHLATFFTDVAPDLVFRFADRHGISHADLAAAYLAVKAKTGEQNPDLEAELVALAPSPR